MNVTDILGLNPFAILNTELSPYAMIRNVLSGNLSGMLRYFVVAGLFIFGRPIFILVMTTFRFESPLKGKNGTQILAMAAALLLVGLVLTGRPAMYLDTSAREVKSSLLVNALGRDTCDMARSACVVAFIDGQEYVVHPDEVDRLVAAAEHRGADQGPRTDETTQGQDAPVLKEPLDALEMVGSFSTRGGAAQAVLSLEPARAEEILIGIAPPKPASPRRVSDRRPPPRPDRAVPFG